MAIIPTERLSHFVEGIDHAEGLCVSATGEVYCGGEAGQLYRVTDGEAKEVANTGGFVAGIASDAENLRRSAAVPPTASSGPIPMKRQLLWNIGIAT